MKIRMKDVFGVFYVMTEGVESEGSGRFSFSMEIFSMFIDVCQVIHVMVTPTMGWSVLTSTYMPYVDVIWIITSQAQRVIPAYYFYALGMSLVIVALADTMYVIKLFSRGHVEKLWPVKLLSVLVSMCVTTGFSSIFNWILLPIDCLSSGDPNNFSSFIRGPGSPCTPFAYPEIVATVPTLVVALTYMFFALITSLLTFSLNPLSTKPRAMCNGRVENLWLTAQMAISIMAYVAQYITYFAANVIMLVFMIFLVYHHNSIFPFHNHVINVVRGGILFMTTWMFIGTIIFGSVQAMNGQTPYNLDANSVSQNLQWVTIGLLPLSFIVGMMATHYARRGLYATLDKLYHEAEMHKLLLDNGGMMCPDTKAAKLTDVETIMPDPSALRQMHRSEYNKFYKSNIDRHRTFASSMHANAAARALLYRKNEKDLKFLNLVVRRGLEEHPYSVGLLMLQIKLLRFVYRNPFQASAQEKIVQMGNTKLGVTDSYILYALIRKASQEKAGTSIGQDEVKAIDLMEYDAGMKKAQKFQLACVSAMKKFWRIPAKKHFRTHNVEEMLEALDDWDQSVILAKKEYAWLLKKYRHSAGLLLSYASFCDQVLNDEKLAIIKREEAQSFEKDGVGSEAGSANHVVEGKAHSVREGSVASEMESRRVATSRYIKQIIPNILGREVKVVHQLHFRIKIFVFILLILGTAAFSFVAYFIFNDVAVQDVSGIITTSEFRYQAVQCSFLQRSQMIAAWINDPVGVKASSDLSAKISRSIEQENWRMYHEVNTGYIRDHFHNSQFLVQLPNTDRWSSQNLTYFTLVSEFTRRVNQAAESPVSELVDPNFSLRTIKDGKRNVVFLQENLFRVVVPMFEGIVRKYEEEVSRFGDVAMMMVDVICAIIACNVFIIAVFVLRALVNHIQTLQHKFVCCCVALTMPATSSLLLFKHFRHLENEWKDLSAMGDGADETNLEAFTQDMQGQGDDQQGMNNLYSKNSWAASNEDPNPPGGLPLEIKDEHHLIPSVEYHNAPVFPQVSSGMLGAGLAQVSSVRSVSNQLTNSVRRSTSFGRSSSHGVPPQFPQFHVLKDETRQSNMSPTMMLALKQSSRMKSPSPRIVPTSPGMRDHEHEAFATHGPTAEVDDYKQPYLTEELLQKHIKLWGGYQEEKGGMFLLGKGESGSAGEEANSESLHADHDHDHDDIWDLASRGWDTNNSTGDHLSPMLFRPPDVTADFVRMDGSGGPNLPIIPKLSASNDMYQRNPNRRRGADNKARRGEPRVYVFEDMMRDREGSDGGDSDGHGNHDEAYEGRHRRDERRASGDDESPGDDVHEWRDRRRYDNNEGGGWRDDDDRGGRGKGRRDAIEERGQREGTRRKDDENGDREGREGDDDFEDRGGRDEKRGRDEGKGRREGFKERRGRDDEWRDDDRGWRGQDKGRRDGYDDREGRDDRWRDEDRRWKDDKGRRDGRDERAGRDGRDERAGRDGRDERAGRDGRDERGGRDGRDERGGRDDEARRTDERGWSDADRNYRDDMNRRPASPPRQGRDHHTSGRNQGQHDGRRTDLEGGREWQLGKDRSRSAGDRQNNEDRDVVLGRYKDESKHRGDNSKVRGSQGEAEHRVDDKAQKATNQTQENKEDFLVYKAGVTPVLEFRSPSLAPVENVPPLTTDHVQMVHGGSPLSNIAGPVSPHHTPCPATRKPLKSALKRPHVPPVLDASASLSSPTADANSKKQGDKPRRRSVEPDPAVIPCTDNVDDLHVVEESRSKEEARRKTRREAEAQDEEEVQRAKDEVRRLRELLSTVKLAQRDTDGSNPTESNAGDKDGPTDKNNVNTSSVADVEISGFHFPLVDDSITSADIKSPLGGTDNKTSAHNPKSHSEGTHTHFSKRTGGGSKKLFGSDDDIRKVPKDDLRSSSDKSSSRSSKELTRIKASGDAAKDEVNRRPSATNSAESAADEYSFSKASRAKRKTVASKATEDNKLEKEMEALDSPIASRMKNKPAMSPKPSFSKKSKGVRIAESEDGDKDKDKSSVEGLSRSSSLKRTNSLGKMIERVSSLGQAPIVIPQHETRTISDETKEAMVKAIKDRQSWYSSTTVYFFALCSIMALSVFCFLYPTMQVKDLINMASTLSQASRRRYLVQSIVHLCRELAINDGFSRLFPTEITSAISVLLEQLKVADEAVRVGNPSLGISVGADDHNVEHNVYMYQAGCPWRRNTTDCTIKGMPGVGSSGLFELLQAFVSAVQLVQHRYQPQQKQTVSDMSWIGKPGEDFVFENITLPLDRLKLFDMKVDRYLAFVMQAFDGDVFVALADIIDILRRETLSILESALSWNKYLYSVHVIVVFVLFYWMLFRRTIRLAMQEVQRARTFVSMMPVHILPQREVDFLIEYFRAKEEDAEDREEHEAEEGPRTEESSHPLNSKHSSL